MANDVMEGDFLHLTGYEMQLQNAEQMVGQYQKHIERLKSELAMARLEKTQARARLMLLKTQYKGSKQAECRK